MLLTVLLESLTGHTINPAVPSPPSEMVLEELADDPSTLFCLHQGLRQATSWCYNKIPEIHNLSKGSFSISEVEVRGHLAMLLRTSVVTVHHGGGMW